MKNILFEFLGKNNGSLEGYIYFQCPNEHGVFVRRDKLQFAD
jgi:dynactin complex subunit